MRYWYGMFSLVNARRYCILAVLALAGGAVIYPLFRGADLWVWQFIPRPHWWEMLRIPFDSTNAVVSALVYSGPDALWLLSGIFLLRALFFHERRIQSLYINIFVCIAIGIEAGQYFGIVPGTYDLIDLLFMSGVALAEGIIYTFIVTKRRKRNETKS